MFGKERVEFFRQYLPFEHGIASDDTFRRVFSQLDSEAFRDCFLRWVASFQGRDYPENIGQSVAAMSAQLLVLAEADNRRWPG